MAEAKLILLCSTLALCLSCARQPAFTWEKFDMDNHRTGTAIVTADNIGEAIGKVENGVYTAPNGKVFEGGSTPAVAAKMLEVQPQMIRLKQVIAYSKDGMISHRPESPLSNWAVDNMMKFVAARTKKKVDVGILNFGGIRVDMPKGAVTNDVMVSMFPFTNHLCYVALKGSDLRKIFEQFASNGKPEVVGGVKLVIDDNKIAGLLVGGEILDTAKVYGVATIDFLLDGGDDITVAKNAKELVILDELMYDIQNAVVLEKAARGESIDYNSDSRVEIINSGVK